MADHPIIFLLVLVTLPVWTVFWPWLFSLFVKGKIAPWVSLLAGLLSVSLAVGFYLVLADWLKEPLSARIAALVYGSPAFFFILWWATICWIRRGQPVESGEHLGEGEQRTS
jgi:hypothetical protein